MVLVIPCFYVGLPFLLKAIGLGLTAALITWWFALLLPLCGFIAVGGTSKSPRRQRRGAGPPILIALCFGMVTIVTFVSGMSSQTTNDFERFGWLTPLSLSAIFASFAIAMIRSNSRRPDSGRHERVAHHG